MSKAESLAPKLTRSAGHSKLWHRVVPPFLNRPLGLAVLSVSTRRSVHARGMKASRRLSAATPPESRS